METYFRTCTNLALSKINLSGDVIDMGGGKNADYIKHLKDSFTRYCVDINPNFSPDLIADLENPLPFESERYDAALLINTLEHIYNTHQLLKEVVRILKQKGRLIIVVPYLMAIHPSPHDFYRFSDEALKKILTSVGMKNITINTLGSGVFIAQFSLIARLLPHKIQIIFNKPLIQLALLLDSCFERLAITLNKRYRRSDYPLGYFVIAEK